MSDNEICVSKEFEETLNDICFAKLPYETRAELCKKLVRIEKTRIDSETAGSQL